MVTVLFIISLIFGRFVPWSLAVTFALFSGRQERVGIVTVAVVILGLVEDVVAVRIMGVSAAVLITLLFVSRLIARQYSRRSVWWWLLLGGIGEVVMKQFGKNTVSVQAVVGQLACLLLVHWIFERWKQQEGIYVR